MIPSTGASLKHFILSCYNVWVFNHMTETINFHIYFKLEYNYAYKKFRVRGSA